MTLVDGPDVTASDEKGRAVIYRRRFGAPVCLMALGYSLLFFRDQYGGVTRSLIRYRLITPINY